jgi:hypothetical protein
MALSDNDAVQTLSSFQTWARLEKFVQAIEWLIDVKRRMFFFSLGVDSLDFPFALGAQRA